EFLPGNTFFPRTDWVRDLERLPIAVGFIFIDPAKVSCSPSSGQECGVVPEGPVRYTFHVEGFTIPTFESALSYCNQNVLDLLIAPESSDALSPSDLLPPNFPFPAPDQFITWAVEDMLIAKGDPVGFLKRSVEPRGALFSTASLSAQPV